MKDDQPGRLVLVERREGNRAPRTFWALSQENFRVLSSRAKSPSSAAVDVGAALGQRWMKKAECVCSIFLQRAGGGRAMPLELVGRVGDKEGEMHAGHVPPGVSLLALDACYDT